MTERGQEPPPAAKASDSGEKPSKTAGKKNAAALSAALRANLARRKVRERALRAAAQKDDSEA
ncbi:hypothetical protein WOC76_16710 [Methylocystis sp. IM3]|jgi:hypothetical protein|uniref:hypothetical protein n=1 Tax=unclassified Methylocystis TaxID=2625913 RepID=UPI0030F5A223